jgi:hypothetical protein
MAYGCVRDFSGVYGTIRVCTGVYGTIRMAYGCEKHYTEWYGWLTGVKNTIRNSTDGLRV